MRKFFVFITLFLLSQVSVWGQVVVGTYHLAATDKDYVVLVDDMRNRFKGKMPNDKLKKCQIYLQVESNTPGIEAYIMFEEYSAKVFTKVLSKKMKKVQKYLQHNSYFRTNEGNAEAYLYMKQHNEVTGTDIYGCEFGQDYEVFYEQNKLGQWSISYIGEAAKSDGNDRLSIAGWQLVLTSEKEVQVICDLIKKARAMIKSNSLNPKKI